MIFKAQRRYLSCNRKIERDSSDIQCILLFCKNYIFNLTGTGQELYYVG